MSSYNDIFANNGGKGKLPEDKLIAYLEGKLSPQEQHEVEQWLAEEGPESDAIEGLQQLETADTRTSVDRINYNLRRELLSKKPKRKTAIKTNNWAIIAVIIILLAAILAYVVIRLVIKK